MSKKQATNINPGFISKEDAAAYMGLSYTAFRDNVRPHIPNYKFGTSVRFKIKDLDRYAESKAEKYQVG